MRAPKPLAKFSVEGLIQASSETALVISRLAASAI
jgi:hypothetical protein